MSQYVKPTWANGSTVPISAANLQAISDSEYDLSYDKWTLNDGQSPAPKPRTGSSDADVGRAVTVITADNTAIVLPANGSWQVIFRGWKNISTGYVELYVIDGGTIVFAGGTGIIAGVSGYYSIASFVRIAA